MEIEVDVLGIGSCRCSSRCLSGVVEIAVVGGAPKVSTSLLDAIVLV